MISQNVCELINLALDLINNNFLICMFFDLINVLLFNYFLLI